MGRTGANRCWEVPQRRLFYGTGANRCGEASQRRLFYGGAVLGSAPAPPVLRRRGPPRLLGHRCGGADAVNLDDQLVALGRAGRPRQPLAQVAQLALADLLPNSISILICSHTTSLNFPLDADQRRSTQIFADQNRRISVHLRSSAFICVRPRSSAFICVRPRSSAFIRVHPRSSAFICVPPRSSAFVRVRPRSSAFPQPG